MEIQAPGLEPKLAPKHKLEGISVILCCHNSATRIGAALKALALQDIPGTLPVEIILVDNASTDRTAHTAHEIWQNFENKTPMRIIYEAEAGLIYARRSGIREANYEILVFCDDDNLLSPGYLLRAYEHFVRRPLLAAVGGFGIPVFEKPPPQWFSDFASSYATGSQSITTESGRSLNLYGAGLAVRKSALNHLYSRGYQPLMTGRKGSVLSGAEDTEMTYALVIAGYMLEYDDHMCFQHVLPAARLQFSYLEKLFLFSAIDGPIRNLYHAYASENMFHKYIKYWPWHFMVALARLVKYIIQPPKSGYRGLYFRWSLEYIRSLFICLPTYQLAKLNIRRIPPYTNLRIATLYPKNELKKMPSPNQ